MHTHTHARSHACTHAHKRTAFALLPLLLMRRPCPCHACSHYATLLILCHACSHYATLLTLCHACSRYATLLTLCHAYSHHAPAVLCRVRITGGRADPIQCGHPADVPKDADAQVWRRSAHLKVWGLMLAMTGIDGALWPLSSAFNLPSHRLRKASRQV
eukprot:359045-Chlamydomonas_euryale.AAC.2